MSLVLTDTAEYIYSPHTYDFRKKNYNITITDDYGHLKQTFVATNEKLLTASIIIKFDKNSIYFDDIIELQNVIKHEIGHLNDMLDENMTQEEINKDILVSNAYKPRLSFSMVDRQYEYFYNCVYKLNWSEERQRVFQVLANLIKMNIGDL